MNRIHHKCIEFTRYLKLGSAEQFIRSRPIEALPNLSSSPTSNTCGHSSDLTSSFFSATGKLEGTQQHMPSGAEVRVVSASVIAQLQAQGLQVRFKTFLNMLTHQIVPITLQNQIVSSF